MTVNNSITVHATTNASPASTGEVVARSVERGTRPAHAGLHDGGLAGSAYQGAP